MAIVNYPENVPLPLLTETSRSQAPTFRAYEPLAGPARIKKTSSDAPVQYDIAWRMSRISAQRFMTWFYSPNGLNRGRNKFTVKLNTEWGLLEHTVQLLPDSLLPVTTEGATVYSYTATGVVRALPIPQSYLDHCDLLQSDYYDNASFFDIIVNQYFPV